jgi:hypothetical protein
MVPFHYPQKIKIMAFIDIFNYKKYFRNVGDSNVARIAHVNSLANRVTAPSTVTQLTDNNTTVNIDAYSGVITMQASLSGAINYKFTVVNAAVTADSVILATVQYFAATDSVDIVRFGTSAIADGSFAINIMAQTVTAGPIKIHFLVIN